MENQKSEKKLPVLTCLAANILGSFIRLNTVHPFAFSLNEHGLVVQMISDQLKGKLRIPELLSCSFLQNPFSLRSLSRLIQGTDNCIRQQWVISNLGFHPTWLGFEDPPKKIDQFSMIRKL